MGAGLGALTIPQVVVGCEHIGGCIEMFEAFADGRLQLSVEGSGVPHKRKTSLDPYSPLPKWLQPR